MRELHDGHGGRHRHVRDAAVEAPKHTRDHSHNPRKLEILSDPAARVAESLRLRKSVQQYEAKHAAGHLKPQEAMPEHAPPETRDEPAGKIDKRTKTLEGQREDRRTPERSRLPKSDTAQMVAGYGIAVASLADAVNILPGKWDVVLGGFLGAAVATVAWANRRWKEKHGHRPED